jgi:hypothetical protein
MAETATFPHRWVLPCALLVVLLASHNEFPSTSYQSGAPWSQFWKCEVCGWIERKSPLQDPLVCCGAKDDPHDMAVTILLEGGGHARSRGPRRFK